MNIELDNQLEKIFGIIYCIRNRKDDKKYVGQTLSHITKGVLWSDAKKGEKWKEYGIYSRFMKHYSHAKSPNGAFNQLHFDMKKYGINEFEITEMIRVPGSEIEKLDSEETRFIKELNTLEPKGYNVASKGVSLCKSKQLVLDYYRKVEKVVDERKPGRSVQKTLSRKTQQERIDFFLAKNIENVAIRPIKRVGMLVQVRAVVLISGEKDRYRISYTNMDMKLNVKLAKEFANSITVPEKIHIHEALVNILNGNPANVYKYAEKLAIFSQLDNVNNIFGNKYWQKSADSYIYSVIFTLNTKPVTKKKISFGGKKSAIEKSYEDALEFVKRLPYSKNTITNLKQV